jgi:hypothetical protein
MDGQITGCHTSKSQGEGVRGGRGGGEDLTRNVEKESGLSTHVAARGDVRYTTGAYSIRIGLGCAMASGGKTATCGVDKSGAPGLGAGLPAAAVCLHNRLFKATSCIAPTYACSAKGISDPPTS